METILEWYQKQHHYLDAPCGGNGTCGKCKVQFLSEVQEPTQKEVQLLSKEELEAGIRLACLTPMTEKTKVQPLWDTFGAENKEKKMTGRKAEASDRAYGIAFDLGTTTLAMSLLDLKTKEEIAAVTSMNHQRAYGADVISRIQAANEGKLQELCECIKRDIKNLITELLELTQIQKKEIQKMVIAGNTTMCHLLLGYSCKGLGETPFLPVDISLQKINRGELIEGLDAEVVILPGISAFVGADIVAGVYNCDMDLTEKPQMLIDVGTNGEIVLGNKNGFWVTSTSAGPVFEGGGISCGMPAIVGAVSHVDLQWNYEVLGKREMEGFCGSGLIDLAAVLCKKEIIDENGTLCDAYFEKGYVIPLSDTQKAEVSKSKELKILQEDIRQLQMGKAAIRAGIECLMKKLSPEIVFVAGGFGVSMELESAIKIELFPESFRNKIKPVGNASLAGAKKFLFDENGEQRVREIVQNAKEILLAKEEEFEERYIGYMQF